MQFDIQEASEVPPIKHRRHAMEQKYDPAIEAAMASSTGIVSIRFDEVKEAKKCADGLHVYLKRMGLTHLFKVHIRQHVVYVRDLSREGTRAGA